MALPPGLTIPADANSKGVWGPVTAWPVVAVHGVLTADGRVLSYGTKTDGTQTGLFVYDIWNPADDSHLTIANPTGVDIFCSSQVMLPGGDAIAISGGDNWTGTSTTNTGNPSATVLDLSTNVLAKGSDMNRPRWYSTSTMLLNGEVYVQGGTGGTDLPEIRGSNGTYRLLGGAGTGSFDFMYPRNFIAPDGRVFGFASGGQMYYVNTSGSGSITDAGTLAVTGSDASAAMFAPGRILQYGGNANTAVVIDINSGTPVVTSTAPTLRQRRLSVATILPDGKVLATGGSSVWNAMTNVSYEAEIWNPQTGQWTVGASAVRPRLYHGNALLLPDASVLVFGGGAPAPSGSESNLNREIYYPPYLFAAGGVPAARPVIATAPTVVDVGRTVQLRVTSGRPISRVTMVKTGSATHGFNMDQRFVNLPFIAQGGTLAVQIPARASDLPPGMWMMFAIDDAGVPSEAKLMRVNVAPALNTAVTPVLASPGNQSTVQGNAVSLAPTATDPNGDPLQWSASGLPPGLTIDAASGRITGAPTAAGTYAVTLAVSDGFNSASVNLTWDVTGQAPLVLAVPQAQAPTQTGGVATFTASATGQNVMYSWDFGDGTPATGFSPNPRVSHAFTRAGVFYVTVAATDGVATRYQTILHTAYLPLSANAPVQSTNLLIETRGTGNARLWLVNPDNDSVSVFDAVTRAKLAEVAVGAAPRSLALTPAGNEVWVANKRGASISVISTSTLAVMQTVSLARGSQPYGIAMARAANAAVVALEAGGALLRIDLATRSPGASAPVGLNVRHVSVAADGRTAYAARFITPPLPGEATAAVQASVNGTPVGGEVVVVDAVTMAVQRTITLAHSNDVDAETQGRGIPNYLGAPAVSPDGTQAFVPSKKDNILRGMLRDGRPLDFQNTVRSISSRIDLGTQQEDLAGRIDHDNASMASAALFDPLGVYLFVALETSREVAVLDAHGRQQLMRIDVGRAPQGLAISPDRRTLYVHNFMDRTVGVFDLTPLVQQGLTTVSPVATLNAVASERLSATVLKGKQFFYDARDTRLARDRYMSCAACHNDGGHDGRVWDLTHAGEGLRNTINLRGRAATAQGFLHWSNNFDELQDFEGQIRALAGGTGLMTDAQFNTGTRSQPLGDAKAGVSADLDALAAYVASLNAFEPSPLRPSAGALSALASEGKQVFTTQNCAACHGGTAFTISASNNPRNIGTIKPSSGQRLGGALTGIDVPTLRDVWATAPYLHDGSAPTLEAAVRAHNNVSLSDADITRVAAYLREIGSDEATAPSPQANGGGLVGRYYAGTALAGSPLLTRTEAVNFNWGSASPGAGVPANLFSARWTGTITIPTSGSYRFRTVSDDGVRLWVNGAQLINNWSDHAATTNTSGSVSLTAGQRVAVTLEYYENGGSAVMRLQWRLPGTSSYVAIPLDRLNAN
ncbi:MAG: PA14 domain-containing protein [Burkholderiaceae bacterium]